MKQQLTQPMDINSAPQLLNLFGSPAFCFSRGGFLTGMNKIASDIFSLPACIETKIHFDDLFASSDPTILNNWSRCICLTFPVVVEGLEYVAQDGRLTLPLQAFFTNLSADAPGDGVVVLFSLVKNNSPGVLHTHRPSRKQTLFSHSTLLKMTKGLMLDFRNTLGIITGYSEMVRDSLPVDLLVKQDLNEVLGACNRGQKLLEKISMIGTEKKPFSIQVQSQRFLTEVFVTIKAALPKNIVFQAELVDCECYLQIDPLLFEQVLLGVCLSLSSMSEREKAEINIQCRLEKTVAPSTVNEDTTKETFSIAISSNLFMVRENVSQAMSSGIDHDIECLSEIEEALQVAAHLTKTFGGALILKNEGCEVSEITINLPVIKENSLKKPTYNRPPQGCGELILVVDDEPAVADITEKRLLKFGYKVEKRTNPIEALEFFKVNHENFSLVITDQVMPELPGLLFAEEVKKISPHIPILMITGYSSGITRKKCTEKGVEFLAMKPLDERELALIVARSLNNGKRGKP